MNMVSVYSGSTFIQLHNCTAFIASELLRQVTFFGKQGGYTSGLIVEEAAGCNFYANVDDAVLSGDFTRLPEDLMICGVALSLTETLDTEDRKSTRLNSSHVAISYAVFSLTENKCST